MRVKTPTVQVGNVSIGSKHPIVIQSMTDTDTADIAQTTKQIIELIKAGSQIVRFTVNSNVAAEKVPDIRKSLDKKGYKEIPIVGDFHFNGHILLSEFPEMAKALDKYRINPGNIGTGKKHDENFTQIIKIAIKNEKPVRIGVNGGSLDPELLTSLMNKNAKLKKPKPQSEVLIEAMVKSALDSAHLAERIGLKQADIVLSVKMSSLPDTVKAYELLAKKMKAHPYAIHLGLTHAGSGLQATVASSAALGILLNKGIGDTIRISLTTQPGQARAREVETCKALLQAMELKHYRPQVTSCPGCGRTDKAFFQKLNQDINKEIDKCLEKWLKKYPKVTNLKVAVMGCVVNGPGESNHSDIAISLPGKTEKKVAPVYIKGKYLKSLTGNTITKDFIKILEEFIKTL